MGLEIIGNQDEMGEGKQEVDVRVRKNWRSVGNLETLGALTRKQKSREAKTKKVVRKLIPAELLSGNKTG